VFRKRRKFPVKKRFGLGAGVLVLLLVLAGTGLWWFVNLKPVSNSDQTQLFEIKQGMTAVQVANALEDMKLVRNSEAFRQLCRWQKADFKIVAGVYYLSPAMSSRAILDTLIKGAEQEAVRITIPEGFTVVQIVNTLVNNGLGTEDEYYNIMSEFSAKNYDFLEGAPKGKNRLEGFLFPDTYFFDKKSKPEDVINRFLQRFAKEITPDTKARLKAVNLSVYDWVLKASLVEREAKKQEERPVIAGVFDNRLRINMPLQSCATVLYVLGEVKTVLSIEDTKIDSPYNTYKYSGLPPGPIANPGDASLQAALYPAKTDYLYFVAKNDGTHAFSVTYSEHLKNVQKYE